MSTPRLKTFALPALAALFIGAAAQAHETRLGAIHIEHPYARATLPGQPVGGGFVKLTNRGVADRLLSASAQVGKSTELHSMSMQGDTMRMQEVDAIALPAGQSVELRPGGLHIMFMGLKAPLKAGDTFPMRLRFERAGEVEVTVQVEAATPPGAGGHAGH